MQALQILLTLTAARLRSDTVKPNKVNTDASHLLPSLIACVHHKDTIMSSSPILFREQASYFPRGVNDVVFDPRMSPHLISAPNLHLGQFLSWEQRSWVTVQDCQIQYKILGRFEVVPRDNTNFQSRGHGYEKPPATRGGGGTHCYFASETKRIKQQVQEMKSESGNIQKHTVKK